MGDVAGVGPEVIAKAWPELHAFCRPVVVGDPAWMRRAFALTHTAADVVPRVIASMQVGAASVARDPLGQGIGV